MSPHPLTLFTDVLLHPLDFSFTTPKPSNYHAPSTFSSSRECSRVVSLTNAERAKRRLRPLRPHGALVAAAKAHTLDQAFRLRRMSHRGSDRSTVGTRLRRVKYTYRFAAENVAHGQVSAQHVVDAWMHSRGHRRNLLSKDPTHIGVYACKGHDGRLFWTQVFGAKK